MFIFRIDTMIGHFQSLMPTLWEQIETIDLTLSNISEVYNRVEPISFDLGVMDKLDAQVCISCDMGWSDVGSWDEMADLSDGERGNENVFPISAKDNYVYPKRDKLYSLVGVDELLIVDTEDVLLVTRKGHAQKVREVVETLKKKGIRAASQHEHIFDIRPWGRYDVLATEPHFNAKIITVAPQSCLSYQSHKHREEHWIVVQGQGEVLLNGETQEVKTGDYILIPKQSKHRMINPHNKEMQFVEVQLGDYFGEDDITRYEDEYNRD